MSLEDEVLKRITPDAERRERIRSAVSSLTARVESQIHLTGQEIRPLLVGSVAKDTYLNQPDIDMFMLFSPSVPKKRMEEIGLSIGRTILDDVEERYAEHPYVHGTWEDIEVDLVPCYEIQDTSELKSAVDRTPFHTEFIKKSLNEQQRNEVRLLKQFAKGIGVYGAEARTQGFSGYLLELLTIEYGSFHNVLAGAVNWRYGETITLQGTPEKKFTDPFVFYDPVDLNRNVASALSVDSFATFIFASKSYLNSPSERFFFPCPFKEWDLERIIKAWSNRGTSALVIDIDLPDITEDNLYPQIRKSMDGLGTLLEQNGFIVLDTAFIVDDKVHMVYELETEALPLSKKHVGPPVWITNAAHFLEKWSTGGLSEPYIEMGHWTVMVRREHPTAAGLIESKGTTAALGSDLRDLKGLKVSTGRSSVHEGTKKLLTKLLDKRKPWQE